MATPVTPEPPVVSMSAFMPHLGQPGSLDVFNGENISDYLVSPPHTGEENGGPYGCKECYDI